VIGSEGHGLSPAVRRRCDLFVRLPMRGAIDSLNAAVAGSILLFEILGQREADAGSPAAQTNLRRPGPAHAADKPGTRKARKPAVAPATAGDEASVVAAEPRPAAEPDEAAAAAAAADAAAAAADAPPKKRTRASFGKVKPAAKPEPAADPGAEADGPALLPD
jgi:hypothetical protein